MDKTYLDDRAGAVAVIGMSGRWPGAVNPDELWDIVANGRETVRRLEDQELEYDVRLNGENLTGQKVVGAAGVLKDVDQFDASFFNIYPKEAELMDPQHRLFLECAWEAIEGAGYNPEDYPGMVGVFAGSNQNSYLLYNLCSSRQDAEKYVAGIHPSKFQLMIGNAVDFLPTRVAYKFNLKGPAVAVQTACSTSLVSVNQACINLLTYQCDVALAGGAAISFPQRRNYFYDPGGMLSGDGCCRPFDADAAGTVFSNGMGVVVLKRLEDAIEDRDPIRAVILGSAINNDGSDKVGFAAPSINQQAEVVRMAQELSGVDPESISYVETHGTGTPLGDPIEISALTKAFQAGTDKKQFCALGAVKANIGHMDSAAGISGLIKAVLCMEKQAFPPILNFQKANPHINFENSPFYPVQELTPWKRENTPRRAGVSSFGVGGTNAHAILEEAPKSEGGSASREVGALVLSARTESALKSMRTNLAAYLDANRDVSLADVGYTLKLGRKEFEHRLVTTYRSHDEVVERLKNGDPRWVHVKQSADLESQVIFMFPGQGAQYPEMGCELYEKEPVYRDAVDRCAEILAPIIGEDIRDILFPASEDGAVERINQTGYTQPCIFIVEYALACLWMSWGIKPVAVLGHSIGEYAAGVIAEVFSLETALKLLAERARLIQSLPGGSMLAVGLPEDEVGAFLGPDVSVAAVNGAAITVLSGTDEAIQLVADELEKKDIFSRTLSTSHGFHSPMMEPILDDFLQVVQKHEFNEPRLEWISSVTGEAVSKESICSAEYWSQQIRKPVRFFDAVNVLLAREGRVFLEVGPGNVLGTMTRQNPSRNTKQAVVSSFSSDYQPKDDYEAVMLALGDLWAAGVKVDWPAFYGDEQRLRVQLPTYPFERKSFWKEPPVQAGASADDTAQAKVIPDEQEPADSGRSAEVADADESPSGTLEKELAQIIFELSGVDMISEGHDVTFAELGIDSLLALRMFSIVEQKYGVSLPLASMIEAPTIPALAQRILDRGMAGDDEQRLVVQMTGDVADRKLFLVHAAEGGILFYKDLAEELRSVCSVYGLEAPWLMSNEMAAASMEEVATEYLKMIRSVQPEGPYLLAGFCYGGVVAFEMANQLHAAGESVSQLILFDSSNPMDMPTRYGTLKRLQVNLQLVKGKSFGEKWSTLSQRVLGKLGAQKRRMVTNLRYRMGQVAEGVTGKESADKKVAEMTELHEKLYFEYKPKPYDGDMLLIEGMDREPMFDYPESLGWSSVVTGDIKVFQVEAEHMTMLQYPSAVEIGDIIKQDMLQQDLTPNAG